jgi:hypothetical protein
LDDVVHGWIAVPSVAAGNIVRVWSKTAVAARFMAQLQSRDEVVPYEAENFGGAAANTRDPPVESGRLSPAAARPPVRRFQEAVASKMVTQRQADLGVPQELFARAVPEELHLNKGGLMATETKPHRKMHGNMLEIMYPRTSGGVVSDQVAGKEG